MKLPPLLSLALLAVPLALSAAPPPVALPPWVRQVGARLRPAPARRFWADRFGAAPDGTTDSTAAIQRAIDACAAAGGGTVSFPSGRYVTAALFLKSHVHLLVPAGVTLLGSQDETAYPSLPTRVAGIEMTWPAALINVRGQEDVAIEGAGTIDGRGKLWWDKYWNLRKLYDRRGLRWAADYDCRRVRLIVIWKSHDVALRGLHLRRSGFWTVQLAYSEHLTVDGIRITDNAGPSTDGVDVDSSRRVEIARCDIDNNDDDICLKAGRDYDGLRVNRPTEYVFIHDNLTRRGAGMVTIGSETAGFIRHVVAWRNRAVGTSEGIRFKSARVRGGGASDVLVWDADLRDVPLPFTFTLDWDPAYSYAVIPPGLAHVPEYWRVIATPVTPPERGLADFRDITIADVRARDARRILSAEGLPARPLGPVLWRDVTASGRTAGYLRWADGWSFENVRFEAADGRPLQTAHDQPAGPLPEVAAGRGGP